MKSIPVKLLLAAFLVAIPSQMANAAVPTAILQQVPADAQLIVATGPLGAVNKKVSALVAQLGIPGPQGQPMDVLNMFSAELGLPGALDPAGSAVLVIGDLTKAEQSMMAFLPVLDTQGALTALNAEKDATFVGLWKVDRLDGYAVTEGKHLIISPSPEYLQSLKSLPKGPTLLPLDQQLFESNDIAVKVNLTAAMPMARGMISMQLMNNPDFIQNPARMKLINLGLDRLSEIAGGSLGLRLHDAGLNYRLNLHATPGSKLAAFLDNHPSADPADLTKLPQGSYASAGVAAIDGSKFQPALDAIFDFLGTEPSLKEKVTPEKLTQLRSLIDIKMTGKGAFGSYIPDNMTPGAPVPQAFMGYYTYSEPVDTLLEKGKKATPAVSEIAQAFGFQVPMTYQSAVAKAGDLSYDEVRVDMSALPLPPQTRQQYMAMWGPDLVFKEQFCKIDDHTLAVGLGEGQIEKIVAFAREGGAGLDRDPDIQIALKNLPPKAGFYSFVHLGNYIRQMLSAMPPQMMMMGGMFTQIQGVAGMCVSMDDGSLQLEAHLPSKTIQSIGQAIMPFMMMMQGGMQQGPPPGAMSPPSQPGQ